MCNKIISALEGLKSVHLLNSVGEALLEFVKKNPDSDTMAFMETSEYADMDVEDIQADMSTSSLVGCDVEKAIQEWIAEKDVEVFLREYLEEGECGPLSYTFTNSKDIRDYFDTDSDMLEAYEAGEFSCLVVTVDHQKRTAKYTCVNEYHDAPAQEDDYEGVVEFLRSHV